jgi:hypothetical protein
MSSGWLNMINNYRMPGWGPTLSANLDSFMVQHAETVLKTTDDKEGP